jgi:transposase
MRYKFTKEDYEKAAMVSKSIAGVCRELNIRPVGGNYKTINNKIKEYGINIEHFTGQGWNRKENFKPFGKTYEIDDILTNKVKYTATSKLRLRLIKDGYKENKCEKCGLKEWMGNQIPLELNHINGDNMDNYLENLEILCCNCHAQTYNWRGRKIKKSSKLDIVLQNYEKNDVIILNITPPDKFVLEDMITQFSLKDIAKNFNVGVSSIKGLIKKYGINFKKNEMTIKSKENKINSRKVIRPSYETLINEIKETSYLAVGRKYGVSDNTIRKWVKWYEKYDE